VLKFVVQYQPGLHEERFFTQETVKLSPLVENTIESGEIKIIFPPDALYDTVDFKLAQISGGTNGLATYQLHNANVPLHEPYKVVITPSEKQPDSSKVIMRMSGKGIQVVKPVYDDGKFVGSFDRLGILVTMTDTIPPNIATTFADGAVLSKKGSISFSVKDGLSAVEKVRGEIDDQWVLFEKRGNTYRYKIDDYCGVGNHVLKVTAEDTAGNSITKSYRFTVKQNAKK
jgi:hypothetical protein